MTYENETRSSGFRVLLYFLQMTYNLHIYITACLYKITVYVTCSFSRQSRFHLDSEARESLIADIFFQAFFFEIEVRI